MTGRSTNAIAAASFAERRGFVLGQTLAEIMLLILFVILLAIGTSWLRDRQELQALADSIGVKSSDGAGDAVLAAYRQSREQNQRLARELAEALAATQRAAADLERFRQITTDAGPLTPERARALAARVRELEKAEREVTERAKSAEKQLADFRMIATEVGELEKARRELAERAKSAEKELEDFRKIATEEGPLTPARATAIVEKLAEAKRNIELLGQGTAIADILERMKALETYREAVEKAGGLAKVAQVGNENDRLTGTVADLRKQLQSSGKGLVFPSCLYDPVSGETYFLYDAALRSGGIEVREVPFPGRAARLATLPKASLDMGQTISDRAFLDGTRALYQWSVEKECRFYVNIYDATGANEKALYKQRLDIVERHFYKRFPRGVF